MSFKPVSKITVESILAKWYFQLVKNWHLNKKGLVVIGSKSLLQDVFGQFKHCVENEDTEDSKYSSCSTSKNGTSNG